MAERHPKVSDIIDIMEQWAPAWLAESWDNVGLLAGSYHAPVKEAWVALEASPALLARAMRSPVQMLLFHHPPIFSPLKNLNLTKPTQSALIKAAASGLNLFAAHTNLDAADGGVNHALADCLGLLNCRSLTPVAADSLLKVVVYAPEENAPAVSAALFNAGAGHIGNYQECAFMMRGQGQFKPMDGARPHLGRRHELAKVDETRLEVILPKARLNQVLRALYRHHPYEEPAFDIIPLLNTPALSGFGRVGDLPTPESGQAFSRRAARVLKSNAPVFGGKMPDQVQKVAVLGGAGAFALQNAAAAGAQVFITGEAGYHTATDAEDLNICMLVLGHYATEAVIVPRWARRLKAELKGRGFSCAIRTPATSDMWQSLK